MEDPPRMRVLLLAESRVVMPEGGVMPRSGEVTQEVRGRVRSDGEPMAFVRAEMAVVTWTALVRSTGLEADDEGPGVTSTRQGEAHPPLSGWALFW